MTEQHSDQNGPFFIHKIDDKGDDLGAVGVVGRVYRQDRFCVEELHFENPVSHDDAVKMWDAHVQGLPRA